MLTLEQTTPVSFAFVIAADMAGCSGGDGSPQAVPSPAPTVSNTLPITTASPCAVASAVATGSAPTPTATASTTAPTPIPVATSATFAVNGAGGTATVAIQSAAPGSLPEPQPSGTPVLYFTIGVSNAVAFVGNTFGVTSVTSPSALSATGTFVETFYDETTGTTMGSATGTVSGSTIAFGTVENAMSFTLYGSDVYLFEITRDAGA